MSEKKHKNPLQKARFLQSAQKLSQCPPDQGIEVGFMGRSNVGKSSLLNALCEQKNLARTSKTPGRTQLINFFAINEHQRLVDLPGYGYAKVSKEKSAQWQKDLTTYLERRRALKALVLLIDIRHGLKESDINTLMWCDQIGLPILLVLTKADKVSRNQALQMKAKVEKETTTLAYFLGVYIVSAQKKTGLEPLRQRLIQWFDEHSEKSK